MPPNSEYLKLDELSSQLSDLGIHGKEKTTIQLVDSRNISKRHQYENKLQENVKYACYKSLSPHLDRLGIKSSLNYFKVSSTGDVFLALKSDSAVSDKKLKEIKKAMETTGMNDWIKGYSGWKFSPLFSSKKEQKSTLDALNKLQDVFKTTTLVYKMDILRYIYGTKEILRKSSDICDYNHDVRNLCEILIAIDRNPNEKPKNNRPGLLEISAEFRKRGNCEGMTVERRWGRITRTVYNSLMKPSTNGGPSSSVQWAAHPPKNRYPRSVITKESQGEVVNDMLLIVRNLFWGKAENAEKGVGGVGDVWFNNKKRRVKDWENNDDCLRNFESPEALMTVLNKEY